MSIEPRVLVISGSMGSGKTTVMTEASDILTAAGIAHAAIDADLLGIVHLPESSSANLALQNLAAVWRNYAAAGVTRLLLASAVESAADRDALLRAIPGAHITICRLRAAVSTMQERVRRREPGMLQQKLVDRVAELEAILDSTGLAGFSVANEDRPVTAVAREI
ncbi:MAG TPA: hypothetical protein VNA04_03205, partial [Thermoanaerobaculia bacterium]|nr:hypothetical protein [Thermoanaerobaculia bacterium]